MVGTVALAVPETVTARYVVTPARAVPDPVALAKREVRQRVSEPLRGMALSMLDSRLVTVEALAAADFPPAPAEMLAIFGATDAQLSAIGSASHVIVVQAVYEPGWPPAHEWVARVLAGVLAGALDAPLVDAFTPRVLTQDMVGEIPS